MIHVVRPAVQVLPLLPPAEIRHGQTRPTLAQTQTNMADVSITRSLSVSITSSLSVSISISLSVSISNSLSVTISISLSVSFSISLSISISISISLSISLSVSHSTAVKHSHFAAALEGVGLWPGTHPDGRGSAPAVPVCALGLAFSDAPPCPSSAFAEAAGAGAEEEEEAGVEEEGAGAPGVSVGGASGAGGGGGVESEAGTAGALAAGAAGLDEAPRLQSSEPPAEGSSATEETAGVGSGAGGAAGGAGAGASPLAAGQNTERHCYSTASWETAVETRQEIKSFKKAQRSPASMQRLLQYISFSPLSRASSDLCKASCAYTVLY